VEREKKTRTSAEKIASRRVVRWVKSIERRLRLSGVLRLLHFLRAATKATGRKRLQGKSQTMCRLQKR
jgi:hypothetical protein